MKLTTLRQMDNTLQNYKGIFNTDELKVLDTCAIIGPFSDANIDANQYFLNSLEKIVNDSVSFPEEAIEEYLAGIKRSLKYVKERKGALGNRRNDSNTKRIKKRLKDISHQARLKRAMLDGFSDSYSTESHFSQEGRDAQPNIAKALIAVAREIPDLEDEDIESDAVILSKAVAASYDVPTNILTRDRDLVRLFTYYNARKRALGDQYGFAVPENEINVTLPLKSVNRVYFPENSRTGVTDYPLFE